MQGIIYKVMPYSEHAKLLFVYTEEGKLTLIAQGVQKIKSEYRTLAQYLTLIEFEQTKNKTMYRLAGAKLLNDYAVIKEDYKKTKDAALMLEIIDQVFISNEPHDYFLKHIIEALDSSNVLSSSLSFSLKILNELGFQMNLRPNGKKVRGINVSLARLIYEDEDISIDLDTYHSSLLLKLIGFKYNELPILSEEEEKQLKQFIKKYYEKHLEVILRTLQ